MLQAGFVALLVGSVLLGQAANSMPLFIIATLLIGFGVGATVGGAIRFIVLAEAPSAERTTAQGLINICTSIGTLLAAALIGTIAEIQGGGVAGLTSAYTIAAVIAGLLLLCCLALKNREQEQHTLAAAPTPAAAISSTPSV